MGAGQATRRHPLDEHFDLLVAGTAVGPRPARLGHLLEGDRAAADAGDDLMVGYSVTNTDDHEVRPSSTRWLRAPEWVAFLWEDAEPRGPKKTLITILIIRAMGSCPGRQGGGSHTEPSWRSAGALGDGGASRRSAGGFNGRPEVLDEARVGVRSFAAITLGRPPGPGPAASPRGGPGDRARYRSIYRSRVAREPRPPRPLGDSKSRCGGCTAHLPHIWR